jgi:hypothetical protein
VGGAWPQAARRAVKWGDGWIPVGDPEGAIKRMPELHALAKEAGRNPASIEVSIYFAPADPALLGRLRDAGVARAIFGVPTEPREKVLPILDRYRELARQVG